MPGNSPVRATLELSVAVYPVAHLRYRDALRGRAVHRTETNTVALGFGRDNGRGQADRQSGRTGDLRGGRGLEQFREYAVNSLKLNKMDPKSHAATRMLAPLKYVDSHLDDPASSPRKQRGCCRAASPGTNLPS